MNAEKPFGRLIKEYRHSLDLTQAELARRVACATITIRKVEANALRPSQQIAERLAMALAIPLEERPAFTQLARMACVADQSPPSLPTPSPTPEEIGREDLSGRAIRGYELGERIGTGGFGVVYRASQPLVEREVAIKIILPQYADHTEFIRRFEAEAQLVARLEHPYIVPLYDYWREPGVAYLVMRLLRGGSLQAKLKRGPLALEAVASLLEQIGAALHAAHRAGVVHRDLKPANVLLDEDGNAYLADFGIAKNLNLEGQTQAGAIIGSPAYLSPEQILSEPVRPLADIYCLGVLTYELLTGQKPFRGPTPIEYIQQHLSHSLPPLATYQPALPVALDAVIGRATAKNPADRYPDVPGLLADFRQALAPAGVAATPHILYPAAMPDEHVENPYKGLRAFGEADADDFFGRETLVQDLLGRMAEADDGMTGAGQELARFLAVIGPSGSGKSSVVKAGLMPALRRGGLPGSEQWFMVDMLPGAHPWEELEAALLRVAVNPPQSLLDQLRQDERGLLRAVRRVLPANEATELVLVLDQFEEVFTLLEDETERVHFLDSLVTAVLDPRSRLRLIITMRADFIHRALEYMDFGEMIRQRAEFVLPLTPDELELAIGGPAKRVGLVLEPGLVNNIVHDVGEQPGTLPLLQYALTELFERRQGRLLSLAAYQSSGGVRGALARRAEELYAGLGGAGQEATRQLFLRLIMPGEGNQDTRRRVLRAELEALS
ncbi:MAG: protein kinase, partial [Anaerolineales bacterium]